MRLCIERILPPCRERAVKFDLPPIESAADIAAAMKAVTSALAGGATPPGEAATIASGLAMPDLDLIKQVEQGVRDWRGRFARGRSGNPAGRRSTSVSGRSRPVTSSGVCSSSRPTAQ
jgi:hypothetical protein